MLLRLFLKEMGRLFANPKLGTPNIVPTSNLIRLEPADVSLNVLRKAPTFLTEVSNKVVISCFVRTSQWHAPIHVNHWRQNPSNMYRQILDESGPQAPGTLSDFEPALAVLRWTPNVHATWGDPSPM